MDEENTQVEAQEQSVDAGDKDQRIQDLESELQKLKDKELNFERLRKKTESTEKQKQEAESEIQRLQREQDEKLAEIQEENRKWREDQFSEQKEQYFKNMCGDDPEMRKRIEHEMAQLKGEVNTLSQLKAKMERAYLLVEGQRPKPSVFGNLSTTSAPMKSEKKGFADSAEGIDVLNKITRGQVDWENLPRRTSYFD